MFPRISGHQSSHPLSRANARNGTWLAVSASGASSAATRRCWWVIIDDPRYERTAPMSMRKRCGEVRDQLLPLTGMLDCQYAFDDRDQSIPAVFISARSHVVVSATWGSSINAEVRRAQLTGLGGMTLLSIRRCSCCTCRRHRGPLPHQSVRMRGWPGTAWTQLVRMTAPNMSTISEASRSSA